MPTELVIPCAGTNSYSTLLKIRQRGEKTEVTGRRRKRGKQPLERKGYWKLKEDALDRTVWRTRFGEDTGPVARQITNEWDLQSFAKKLVFKCGHARTNKWKIGFRSTNPLMADSYATRRNNRFQWVPTVDTRCYDNVRVNTASTESTFESRLLWYVAAVNTWFWCKASLWCDDRTPNFNTIPTERSAVKMVFIAVKPSR